MIRRAAVVFPLALLACAAPAVAQISGEFVGNRARVCMNSSNYDDASLALVNGGAVSSGSEWLVLTLNSDGSASASGRGMTIGHAATGTGATPASEFEFTCSSSYTFTPPGTINITGGVCTSTTLSGPNAGQVIQVIGQQVEYQLAAGNTVLVSQETTPHLETVHNLTTGVVSERVCHRGTTRFLAP